MVRILTCHHFGGQKIGKCDEALQLAVAGEYIVVALENQMNVYAAEPHRELTPGKPSVHVPWNATTKDGGEIGTGPINFDSSTSQVTGFKGNSPGGSLTSPGVTRKDVTEAMIGEGQIKLSHSFTTVDLIESMSYNRRGNYLLCLETRDNTTGNTATSSSQGPGPIGHGGENVSKRRTRNVRAYFNWDNENQSKPLKARIAGLVSPTGSEPDDDSLAMVEIPVPQPPVASPGGLGANVLAVDSCNILGHVASLTDTGNVHLYSYKLKDGKGRGIRSPYADFDFTFTVEVPGYGIDSFCLNFTAGVLAVSSRKRASVFRICRQGRNRMRSMSQDSSDSSVTISSGRSRPVAIQSPLQNKKSDDAFHNFPSAQGHPLEKVVYDPKHESVKVHISLIERANQRRKFQEWTCGIQEEIQEEIGLMSKCRLVHSKIAEGNVWIEDLIRLTAGTDGGSSEFLTQLELYPIRIKDELGGISCVVGVTNQAFVYHIPAKGDYPVCKVITYPLTAPLVCFTYDSLFFHALTETGLETYTCRSLYYAARDIQGFDRYINDCPFQYETPSLVGIRPFIGVRHMKANETTLCLLSCPLSSNSGSSTEDSSWTIYALRLPTIDMLYEDISKAALTAKLSNPDTYITLTSELHLILRSYISSNPSMEAQFLQRYKATCKAMGIEDCKRASAMIDDANRMGEAHEKYQKEIAGQELLDRGVTYLNMSGIDLKAMFDEENIIHVKDKKLSKGIARFINVQVEKYVSSTTCLSPKLAAAVTDFLVAHSPESLVSIVINVPALRDCNAAKLLEILIKMTESGGYKTELTIALLLTTVTLGGCDYATRNQVKHILARSQASSFDSHFKLPWLLDVTEAGKPKITDLTVCLATIGSSVPLKVISEAVSSKEISLNEVFMSFSQGISLNSDAEVQHALSDTLTSILEDYFVHRLLRKVKKEKLDIIERNTPQISAEVEFEYDRTDARLSKSNLGLTDEELQVLKTLLRGYLSHLSYKSTGYNAGTRSRPGSGGSRGESLPGLTSKPASPGRQNSDMCPLNCLTSCVHDRKREEKAALVIKEESHQASPTVNRNNRGEANLCLFGKVPSFMIHIIKDIDHASSPTTSAYHAVMSLTSVPDEFKENFIKLAGLLSSPIGAIIEVKQIVVEFLDKKGNNNHPLHTAVRILAESTENALTILIDKYPQSVIYYAKEMFGRSPTQWKVLVQKLKEKIYLCPDDTEIFTTIIESVYLHLANTLAPEELEDVLDKAEENRKYFKVCHRAELANSYQNMIFQLSNEYLQ